MSVSRTNSINFSFPSQTAQVHICTPFLCAPSMHTPPLPSPAWPHCLLVLVLLERSRGTCILTLPQLQGEGALPEAAGLEPLAVLVSRPHAEGRLAGLALLLPRVKLVARSLC